MLGDLTRTERFVAIVLSVALSVLGLVLVANSRDELLGTHGWIIVAVGLTVAIAAASALIEKAPGAARLADIRSSYYDMPIKAGIVISVVWALFGFFVGDWAAWQLAFPDLNLDLPWTNFGRLRPTHTTAVIFGFGGNALIATSFHVVQRTSRARLPDSLSPWIAAALAEWRQLAA